MRLETHLNKFYSLIYDSTVNITTSPMCYLMKETKRKMRRLFPYLFMLKKPGAVHLNLNHSIIANGLIFAPGSTRNDVIDMLK